MAPKKELPIDAHLGTISEALSKSPTGCLVLTAAPGSGKTTRIPPFLSQTLKKRVWVLEPRRVAARASAERVAQEEGWQIGAGEVGYQVRFEKRFTNQTKLIYLTEGLLTRFLQSEPYLESCDILILDEFHERSIHTDLAIALAREIQTSVRPDLKIIVMSATLNAIELSSYLGNSPTLDIPGTVFPVDVSFEPHTPATTDLPSLWKRTADVTLSYANRKEIRDILVFLPGKREIQIVGDLLKSFSLNREIHSLHGSMDLSDQSKVLSDSRGPSQRVILSTNIAETSLTVSGVNCVIDSGLVRIMETDPQLGIEVLRPQRISKFSAIQRQGRAGRQGPGYCHKLWSRNDDLHLAPMGQPEILRVPLEEMFLRLLGLGVNVNSFHFFTKPDDQKILQSFRVYETLGLTHQNKLSTLAQEALKLSLDIRLSAAVVWATTYLKTTKEEIIDSTLEIIDQPVGEKQNLRRVLDRELKTLQPIPGAEKFAIDSPNSLTRLIAARAYPDRIAKLRNRGSSDALMTGGRGLEITEQVVHAHSNDKVLSDGFFVAPFPFEVKVRGHKVARVDKIFPISRREIEFLYSDKLKNSQTFEWDSQKRKVFGIEHVSLLGLPLTDSHPVGSKNLQTKSWELAQKVFLDFVALDLSRFLFFHDSKNGTYLNRKSFLQNRGLMSPERSDGDLKHSLHSFLENIPDKNLGLLSWEDFPFLEFLGTILAWSEKQKIDSLAPQKIQVPSQSWHPIIYPGSEDPITKPRVSVRLQEVFGWSESPTLGNGKIPIVLELLSPGFKPLQITQDLASFWKGVYLNLRGELRARYPKHSWPDDPLNAMAVAKGKHRR